MPLTVSNFLSGTLFLKVMLFSDDGRLFGWLQVMWDFLKGGGVQTGEESLIFLMIFFDSLRFPKKTLMIFPVFLASYWSRPPGTNIDAGTVMRRNAEDPQN